MKPPAVPIEHPALHQRVAESFTRQGMMRHLQASILRVAPGEVELWLPYSDKVTQQQEGFHGGAVGALADIAAGYAGLTTAPEGMEVATAEYKINFLASRRGGALRATGRVIKSGRRLIVTHAEVTHLADDGTASPCAVMQQTLAVVPKTY